MPPLDMTSAVSQGSRARFCASVGEGQEEMVLSQQSKQTLIYHQSIVVICIRRPS